MTAAALIRESLGRVTPMARQVTVDAAVDGFAKQVHGLDVCPPRRREDVSRRLLRALLWGRVALERSQSAMGYAGVVVAVASVLKEMTARVLEAERG